MTRHAPLALSVRALLFQHLAAMEKAGVPPERAYALLDLGAPRRSRVETFRRLFARGVDPATAGANSGLFNLFETRLLRAAFAGGSPQASYERLARSLGSAAAQQRTLRSRLMLPGTVLALALFVQPVPQLFAGVLSPAGYLAKAILPLIVLVLCATLVVRAARWFASGEPGAGRAAIERALTGVPFIGALHLRATMRDFIESLGMLLQAGLPLFDALPVALDTVGNQLVRADLATLLPAVRAGAPLSTAIGALRLVDTAQLFAIVHTGEQSGTLAAMLQRYAGVESAAVAETRLQWMTWLPRMLYGAVALWMALQLLAPAKAAQPSAALAGEVSQWSA